MTGILNMGSNQLNSSANIVTSSTISSANLTANGFFSSTPVLHFQLLDTSMYVSKPITFATGQYMYGSDTAIDFLTLKGTNVKARNDATIATLQNIGFQLEADLLGNAKNLTNCAKVSCASLAGTDGTVIATTTSNQLTLSNAMNANSQNIDNVAMLNGTTFKTMRKYVSSTPSNGSGNTIIAIYPDTGFSIMSVMVTSDLVCRNMQYISVGSDVASYSENVGGGHNVIMTVLCMQN